MRKNIRLLLQTKAKTLVLFVLIGLSTALQAAGTDDFVHTIQPTTTSISFTAYGFNSGSFQEVGAGGVLIGTPTSFATIPGGYLTVPGFTVGSTYQLRLEPNTSTTQEFSGGFNGIKDINQWGTANWLQATFFGSSGLTTLSATDDPIFAPGASMRSMFQNCYNFNSYIGDWNTTNVTNTAWMFREATKFNNGEAPGLSSAPLSWNTSNVTYMRDMFADAKAFNQDIGSWDVSHVTNMIVMLSGANLFDQDLSAWQIPLVNNLGGIFVNTNISTANMDAILTSWAGQTVQSGIYIGVEGRRYCTASAAINTLRTKGWSIARLTQECGSFIIQMRPTSSSYTFQNIEGFSTGQFVGFADFQNSDQTDFTPNLAGGSHTITGLTPGRLYEIRLRPDPTVVQGFRTDNTSKLTDIYQWGTANWKNLKSAFENEDGLTTLKATGVDKPIFAPSADLSSMFARCDNFNSYISDWNTGNVTDMSFMFSEAINFNQNIGTWNTSNVTRLDRMFNVATAFNNGEASGLSHNPLNWNTSNVTNMTDMFHQAPSFNQPIGTWDTGKVNNMIYMFNGATAFNQPIGTWNTAKVTDMTSMFLNATSFDQDLGSWQIPLVGFMYYIFDNTAMSLCNMDKTLIGWAGQTVQSGVLFSAAGREYCRATPAINTLNTTYGWSIDTTSSGALALSATCSGSLSTCTVAELGTIQINGSKLQGCTGTGWIDMADVTAIGPAATTESKIYYDATAHKLLVQEGSNIYQARAPITSCGFTTLSSLTGAAPVEGTLTFDSVTKEFYYHDGTQWVLIEQNY